MVYYRRKHNRRRVVATYNEVMAKIAASTKEDWLTNPDETEQIYKGDLFIRIISPTKEVLGGDAEFDEQWVQRGGFNQPERQTFTIYYGTSFVREVYMVAVDGSRAYMPYPKSADRLMISYWQYKFAQIIQPQDNRLDYYLERSGI